MSTIGSTANINPIFALNPIVGCNFITAANTLKDGTGALVFVASGNTNGTRIDNITFSQANSAQTIANSAMVNRVFIAPSTATNTSTGSTTAYLIAEIANAAVTPSASAIGATATIYFTPPLILPSGAYLYTTSSVFAGNQDKIAVIAKGGDY